MTSDKPEARALLKILGALDIDPTTININSIGLFEDYIRKAAARAADEKVKALVARISEICSTADGWEDGETFYKNAVNSIRIELSQLQGGERE